jgi:hypothetical protein
MPSLRVLARCSLILFALLAGMMAATGCAVPVLERAIGGPETIPKVYELQNKKTLVFVQVDDAAYDLLGSAKFKAQIGDRTGDYLVDQEVLTEFIPQMKVHELAADLGRKYERMPVNEIGHRLGAEQVILVTVKEAALRNHPGLLEPHARSLVRVIEPWPYTRLFPVDELSPDDPTIQPPGHTVITELPRRQNDILTPEETANWMTILAEGVAQDVSRMFYDWKKDK